jgi:hypothetical protein
MTFLPRRGGVDICIATSLPGNRRLNFLRPRAGATIFDLQVPILRPDDRTHVVYPGSE